MRDEDLLLILESKIATINNKVKQRSEHGLSINEADTERIVIEPLLEVLGYDDWHIIQQGRDADTKGIPDYTIIYGNDSKWMLEAKSLTHTLHVSDAQQVVNYANNLGAEWAVLSNGCSWHIYNAPLAKPLTQKLMFQIDDLFTQKNAAQTLSLLSHDAMQNNRLTDAWTKQRLTALISEQLTTQDSETRKLLRRLCSEHINTPVSDKAIETILEVIAPVPVSPSSLFAPQATLFPSRIDTTTKTVENQAQKTAEATPPIASLTLFKQSAALRYSLTELSENPTLAGRSRPIGVRFGDGEDLTVKHWAGLSVRLIEWLSITHDFNQVPFKVTKTSKNFFLNTIPNHPSSKKMTNPTALQVAGKTAYMEACHNTTEKLRTLVLLMKTTGVNPDCVTISLPKAG